MLNDSFFSKLFSWFGQIYSFGDSLILLSVGSIQVSFNNFVLVLAVMGIVLGALLNFAKVHGADIADRGISVASSRGRSRIREETAYNDAQAKQRQAYIRKWR